MRPFTQMQRVAAYIRVSTDHENQEDSYELQEVHFRSLIEHHPGWISAGIYSDYAISGTNKESRVGFTRLMRHCREGRIDHIVTKSISRFARNTRDFLEALELLQKEGVTICFERENMDTREEVNRFVLTAFGAIAQEESRSTSENIRWSIRRNYARGDAKNIALYGYRYVEKRGERGNIYREIEIEEHEAAVVQWIFTAAAEGKSYVQIARELNCLEIAAPERELQRRAVGWEIIGEQRLSQNVQKHCGIQQEFAEQDKVRNGYRGWTADRVRAILCSERYVGDVLLQKKYKESFLSAKTLRNNGELPMYLVKDHHEAIISHELFDKAQACLRAKQSVDRIVKKVQYPLSGMLICGHCGNVYHTRNRKANPIWYCSASQLRNAMDICNAPKIYESVIEGVIQKAALEKFHLSKRGKKGCSQKNPQVYAGRLRAKLEYVHREDFVEKEREFHNRKMRILRNEQERVSDLLRWLQQKHEKEQMKPEEENIRLQQISELQKKLADSEQSLQYETERIEHLEYYWKQLEKYYADRERALRWMETFIEGEIGRSDFLQGLVREYLKAFVLSIVVYSPEHYAIHWFDDSISEIG